MTDNIYHWANIRKLLTKGFNYEDLRVLCFDTPEFEPVYEQFASSTGKAAIVSQLLDFASTTASFLSSSDGTGEVIAIPQAAPAGRHGDVDLAALDQPADQFAEQEFADLTPDGGHADERCGAVGGKPARPVTPPGGARRQSASSRAVIAAGAANCAPAFRWSVADGSCATSGPHSRPGRSGLYRLGSRVRCPAGDGPTRPSAPTGSPRAECSNRTWARPPAPAAGARP